MILGIDEVGRGPWAGPLVVGAVVLGGEEIEGLTDSKKLSSKRREQLDLEIRNKSKAIGLGWVSASEIDTIGLSDALKLATKRAVQQITVPYHEIIIDGTVNFLSGTSREKYVSVIKKADLLIPSVSAASIVAKVARDKYMNEQNDIYPGYDFDKHVGYGTKSHIKAIGKLGICPIHRISIKPLKCYSEIENNDFSSKKTMTKTVGNSAEDVASRFLINNGHKILNRNWKTKFCEIDIVSKKNDVIYFNEVKYRKNSDQGGGTAAIDKNKLRQMKFAVELYVLKEDVSNYNLMLTAVSLSGQPPVVDGFLEIE